MNRYSTFFIVLACAVLLSCTKEKEGIVDIKLNPPHLDSASIQPTSVHIDSNRTIVDSLGNGAYRITISVSAEAIDMDGAGDIGSISFVIRSPRSTNPLLSGAVARSTSSGDTARFTSSVTFVMKRSDAGVVSVDFQARDNSNLVSNAVSKSLIVNRNNSRPEIFNPFVPDTVIRPNSGSRPIFIAISASDSDGVGDIASVFLKSPQSSFPNEEFPLFDDGKIAVNGDTIAGDGRYSTIIPLTPAPIDTIQTREFRFWARDYAGALSDSISRFITIVPE